MIGGARGGRGDEKREAEPGGEAQCAVTMCRAIKRSRHASQ